MPHQDHVYYKIICLRPSGPTWYKTFVFNHVKIQIHVHASMRWIDNLLHAKMLKYQIKPDEITSNKRNKTAWDSLLAIIKACTLLLPWLDFGPISMDSTI